MKELFNQKEKPIADGCPGLVLDFILRSETITLAACLKALAWVSSGGAAKHAIVSGHVKVDSQVQTQRSSQLRPGQVLEYAGQCARLVRESQ